MSIFHDESERLAEFPVARECIFLAHAAVTALPACVANAMRGHVDSSCRHHQEFGNVLRQIAEARKTCADLIGSSPNEIALLGPTSLGLSLFANGLEWAEGDEVIYYPDDYPSNVYPWTNLSRLGVKAVPLRPREPGRITLEMIEDALTPKTKLVALASCHFLTGWKIDVEAIGSLLRNRGVLFSVDAIQTLGAQPLDVRYVDFLSADAHKWMLGPMAIGIVYVRKDLFDVCRPTLLGSWNVRSPNFVAQETIAFQETAQRYEPGVLNVTGVFGMDAALRLLLDRGIPEVAKAIWEVREGLRQGLEGMGFQTLSPKDFSTGSGIVTVFHESAHADALYVALEANGVVASLRQDRSGRDYLRFSPHFYNTADEVEKVLRVVRDALTAS